MEQFLECYLDDFKDAPRNSLHDRRNRKQMVDYINTLIQGCSGAHNNDTEATCKEAIATLIRYHEKAKIANCTVCMMGKYHNILYVAMKLCYLWQMKDAELVCNLLREIYTCEQTFERILIGAIFGTTAPHYIAGWKSDFEDQEENIRGVVYFLDKANHAKLELPFVVNDQVRSYRFVDLPLESCGKESVLKICLQLSLPDKLLIFLRFGALLSNDIDEMSNFEYIFKSFRDPNGEHRIWDTLYSSLEIRYPKRTYVTSSKTCPDRSFNEFIKVFQLLLRVIPAITLCNNLVVPENRSILTRDVLLEKFGDLVKDGLIPISRCGFTPPELKHLCRCSIRHQLWKNFNLPHGIRQLPLPQQMWRYLDILED